METENFLLNVGGATISDSNKGMGLRTFKYSNGYRYFTHVEKEPQVEELL